MTGEATDERAGGEGTDRDPVEFGAGTPPAEWILAGVGALLALGVLVQLVVSGLAREDRPPAFRIDVVEVVAQDGSHLARVEVRNTGGTAAAAVQLEGRLTGDDGSVEQAHAELEHVPVGGARTAGLLFDRNPADGSLTAEVVGFRLP